MRKVFIDLGQSGSRLRDADGNVHDLSIRYRPDLPMTPIITEILAAVSVREADVVGLSLTGLRGSVPASADIGEAVHRATGAGRVAVADDGIACMFGALDGEDGVALAVGSGVVVVAKRGEVVAHRDGGGPLLGDDGSGFAIGRAGLRAALRATEGRGPATAILDIATSRYGELREANRSHSYDDVTTWCIDMARAVLECAADGDAVAVAIRDEAAMQLAMTARAAWRGAGGRDDEPFAVSALGGVMRDEAMRALTLDAIHTVLPHTHWRAPAGDNLAGIERIVETHRQDLLPLLRWWNAHD